MGAIYLTVTRAMGMAMIQCRNHNSHEIMGLCKCVTVKVIKPVAVTAVSSCRMNVRITVYSPKGFYREKNLAADFFIRVTLQWRGGDFTVAQKGPAGKKIGRAKNLGELLTVSGW